MQSLPSPASSPSLDHSDSTSQLSRKRQRSRSMQSDASSSSLKRSIADGGSHESAVRSTGSDQMSSLTLTDPNQDIDSYMAEQGEGDIPLFIPTALLQDAATPQSLPPAEKYSYVEKGKGKRMEIGETWYLISRDWWKRWRKACTGEVDKEGPVTEQDLGPVDNSRLLDSYGNLIPSIIEGVDVEYVPVDVWNSFISWYGAARSPLPRRVIARGAAKQASLELRPPRLKVFRLSRNTTEALIVGPPHPWVEISFAESIRALCQKVAETVKVNKHIHTPYRVWKPETNPEEWRNLEFPSRQLTEIAAKIIDESSKTLEDEGIESDDVFIVEFKLTDGWIVDAAKTQQSGTIEGPPPLFNSNNNFFNRLGSSSSTTATAKTSNDFFSGFGKSPSLSLSTTKSYMKPLEPGVLGLGNMGNTCFMNSALQCLAHTKELSDYFLSGVFKDELNPDNPLGMHGAIAEAFGALLERIWASSGPSTSCSPREFKQQLQRFAPQFSGYQQHDSQELVAFLLDGLHEDLNRVIKKPYVEKPDWEGGGDVELVKLAIKSWEGYMKRNDSVIVDLFQGQYQSTLVCPECSKVSITFDPFMYLTLPLPIQKKWRHEIYYVPWDMNQPHVKVPVEIGRDACFKDLRLLLGRWMNANPDNLLTLEIFHNRFYKNLNDNLPCGDMSDSDIIVCFELPCSARQNRPSKKRPDDPFIIPVFLCDVKAPASRTGYGMSRSGPNLFGYPTIAVIDRQQATDFDAIYDAVVARLQRWTSHARDLYDWEVGSGSIDEVPIQLNGFPPIESVTEITEGGDVVTIQDFTPEESDIVDEKGMVVDEGSDLTIIQTTPRPIRAKKDVFTLQLQGNHKDYGTAYSLYSANNRWESWNRRMDEVGGDKVLLHDGDAFYCEFDENMKAYYFGETRTFEHARWDDWDEFVHPEYAEAKKANAQKRQKGISLEDCLEEFVKEEKLGEDDLWYCPRCKKHQQATKKFDLWKVPDILVVHLKRFSNSRTLRDKIDTFIDFPVDGLDLGEKVGERSVAKRLMDEGVDLEELKQVNLDEPLVYDLFGVDEHMGGLGGGHYRAYASNHLTGKWYHFDDAYVTSARAAEAVNANAYLLFYRRRSSKPLGGKTYQKVMQAHESRPESTVEPAVTIDTQLPTPPNERNMDYLGNLENRMITYPSQSSTSEFWNLRSNESNPGSSVPSPPADDPPDFEEAQSDLLVSDPFDHVHDRTQRYQFPDPSHKLSPTSSNEADGDVEAYLDDALWADDSHFTIGVREADESPERDWDRGSNLASPSYSESSDANPFSDANVQRHNKDNMDVNSSESTDEKLV